MTIAVHSLFIKSGRVHRAVPIVALLLFAGMSNACLAGMTWSARAIDPALIGALKSNTDLLRSTLFGDESDLAADLPADGGRVNLSNGNLADRLAAWEQKRAAEVGDTAVELDKAWHGIHYLLAGSADPTGSVASNAIMGGDAIGPDDGYGPARVLMPAMVRKIAKLLAATTPEILARRFDPKAMTRARIYPDVIWEREGAQALDYLLDYYKQLVAFYARAASRGQAVICVIS